jgi:RimJ/RimL family protein N-acetyltransferase
MYEHANSLTLRKMEAKDLPQLKDLKNESWRSTHQTRFVNMADQEQWFVRVIADSTKLMLMADVKATTVGIFKICGIDQINSSCDVGWDIFKEYRGKGYGKKLVQAGADFCFEALNVHRLNAEILANNEQSVKCAEAAGFLMEGCKRAAVYKGGKYVDSYIYGKIKC